MKVYKKLLVSFLVFLSVFSPISVSATQFTLPKTTVNPDQYLLFYLKRLIEKAQILTLFSKQSKADYYKELTLKRAAELNYVVENRLLSEVEKSTQRLSYQATVLSDYLSANRAELAQAIPTSRELMNEYKIILVKLRDQFPANSSFWLLVQHTINVIDLNLEKLK